MPAGGDTPVAGHDDPDALPDSAGGGGWHSAVAGVGMRFGKRGRNSGVHDRSADKSRTPRDIRCKPADGELLRHESPCPPADGARQRQPIRGRLKPASMRGDLLRVAKLGTLPVARPGPILPPAFDERNYTIGGVH